jgi:hypothetical protein
VKLNHFSHCHLPAGHPRLKLWQENHNQRLAPSSFLAASDYGIVTAARKATPARRCARPSGFVGNFAARGRGYCVVVCVCEEPWTNQYRVSRRDQSESRATDCPAMQSVTLETFTPQWRVCGGPARRRRIGRSLRASRSAWRNTGWPGRIRFQIAASSLLCASFIESNTQRRLVRLARPPVSGYRAAPSEASVEAPQERRHSFSRISSDGGPGIHQPGSSGQGRVRDRAICPAAVRSSSVESEVARRTLPSRRESRPQATCRRTTGVSTSRPLPFLAESKPSQARGDR